MSRSLLLLTAVACTGSPDPADPSDGGDDPADPVGPTWYGEVEPLVRDNCVTCHQASAIAPFALDDYATAKQWAGAIGTAVTDRTMPPWLVTDDGSCQDFANSRWLEDEEIALINDWVAAGAPEGDPALGISDPNPTPPALGRVDLTVTTPEFVPVAEGIPEAQFDEYRCFLIENPADADVYLTGFEVVPGNDLIVHHVLAMPVDPAAPGYDELPNQQAIDAMNGADGRDGWDCFGAAGGNIREKGVPIVWAPGMGAVEFPEGISVALPDSDVLVVQIHYNLIEPASVGQSDSTQIRLRTEASPGRQGYLSLPDDFLTSLFYGQPESIPAGEEAYAYTFSHRASDLLAYSGAPQSTWGQPVELVAVMPHMHALGAEQHVRVIREDGSEECLVEVKNWDFHWQLSYFYEQPVVLNPNDTVEITCVWDSRGLTSPTYPGWGTTSEMCLTTMMLVP